MFHILPPSIDLLFEFECLAKHDLWNNEKWVKDQNVIVYHKTLPPCMQVCSYCMMEMKIRCTAWDLKWRLILFNLLSFVMIKIMSRHCVLEIIRWKGSFIMHMETWQICFVIASSEWFWNQFTLLKALVKT